MAPRFSGGIPVDNAEPAKKAPRFSGGIPVEVNDSDRLAQLVEAQEREIGGWEAAGAGGLSGLYAGWNDELLGAVHGVGGVFSGEGFNEAYNRKASEVRGYKEEAARQQPFAYGAGDVAGSTAGAFVPVAGQAGKAATLGQVAGRGLVQGTVAGGVRGAGDSNGEDVLGNTVNGAVIGGLAGAGAAPLGQLASTVGKGVNRLGNKIIDTTIGGIPGLGAGMKVASEALDTGVNAITKPMGRFGAAANDFYLNGIGGGNGLATKALAMQDPSGVGKVVAGTMLGANVVGSAGDAVAGFAAKPFGGAGIGNVSGAGNNDTPAVHMRDPEQVAQAVSGTQYEDILYEAASKSHASYLSLMHTLAQTDPEFRKLFQ